LHTVLGGLFQLGSPPSVWRTGSKTFRKLSTARQGAEALRIRVVPKGLVGLPLDRRSCATQPLMFGQDQPEQADGLAVFWHGQANTLSV
ncbi:MAG: hypothetical protein R3351_08735, partial [Nitrospirales bacterium]|nr:hypothetical protein [Nitrospirales bacterium]